MESLKSASCRPDSPDMRLAYLQDVVEELSKKWPDNRAVHIVCHGHSVPAGYFATPWVQSLLAYPHQLHRMLAQRYPFAVINVIVTAIGGENSAQGAARFAAGVLPHRPDLLLLDYGLNDRGIGLKEAESSWRSMIESALAAGAKVMLLTPSWDQHYFAQDEQWRQLEAHAGQIRALAQEYGVALADSFAAFAHYVQSGGHLNDLLSHVNHPNELGHRLIATEIARWFCAR